jgi:copper chaperone
VSEGERTYKVIGMTCEHCVAAVRAEVAGLPGVGAVDVDLAGGKLVVRGEVTDEAVLSAVEAAGYSVSASSTNSGPELKSVAPSLQNGPPRFWPNTQSASETTIPTASAGRRSGVHTPAAIAIETIASTTAIVVP